MARFILRRVIDEVVCELRARREMADLAAGRVDPFRDIGTAILAGQMRCGRRPKPLWRVIWDARRERPLGSTFSTAASAESRAETLAFFAKIAPGALTRQR